jgi:hypothetical protein
MSVRFQVTLPDPLAEQLLQLAASRGEPPSSVAALFVRSGIDAAVRDGLAGRVRSAAASIPRQEAPDRPQWLEPYGGEPGWRREMWGAVVALYARYPRHLEALKEGWWLDDAHTEILCALAVWRAQIDDGAENPREELAFQVQLDNYASVLRQQGGGVATAWKPGAPPSDWI